MTQQTQTYHPPKCPPRIAAKSAWETLVFEMCALDLLCRHAPHPVPVALMAKQAAQREQYNAEKNKHRSKCLIPYGKEVIASTYEENFWRTDILNTENQERINLIPDRDIRRHVSNDYYYTYCRAIKALNTMTAFYRSVLMRERVRQVMQRQATLPVCTPVPPPPTARIPKVSYIQDDLPNFSVATVAVRPAIRPTTESEWDTLRRPIRIRTRKNFAVPISQARQREA